MDSIFDSPKMETIFDNAKIFKQISMGLKKNSKQITHFLSHLLILVK